MYLQKLHIYKMKFGFITYLILSTTPWGNYMYFILQWLLMSLYLYELNHNTSLTDASISSHLIFFVVHIFCICEFWYEIFSHMKSPRRMNLTQKFLLTAPREFATINNFHLHLQLECVLIFFFYVLHVKIGKIL